ncbi:MAG TPA: hypothetical protein VHL11_21080 [Phototrophicaceae bacterium]|jgi:hypothetical protein|nr:hypothetical protein [Phototrophicaceae bacterium]
MEPRAVPGGTPEPEVIESETPAIVYVGRRQAYIRRAGCGCAVLLWALFLLIPGFLLVLATQGEVVVWHENSVPEPALHPLLQVKLLMEVETRGLNITTSTPVNKPDNLTCMQTEVRFVLWQGNGNNVSYCDCYQREGDKQPWTLISTVSGTCG